MNIDKGDRDIEPLHLHSPKAHSALYSNTFSMNESK